MYSYAASRPVPHEPKRSRTAGTVGILLSLLETRAAPALASAHAAKVLGDLGALDALPTLRRLAKRSTVADLRAAAREAIKRITHRH